MTDALSRSFVLMRHAKSAWDRGITPDRLRPLNDRGRRAVPLIGRYFAEIGFAPDIVLCSPATRTRETLERLSGDFAEPPELCYEEALYLASRDDLLAVLHELGERWRRTLVIGHNPGLQELAAHLAQEADRATARRIADKFPTAAVALFDCALECWADLSPSAVRAVRFVAPKHLV